MPRVGDEDVLHVGQREAAVPGRAEHRQRRPVGVGGIGLGIAEEQAAVVGEIGIECDVEQSPDARRVDRRQAGDGDRIEPALSDRPQAPVAFGHQDIAIGGEGHAPRPGKARDYLHVDFARFGLEIPGARAKQLGTQETRRGSNRSRRPILRDPWCERESEGQRKQPRGEASLLEHRQSPPPKTLILSGMDCS
jgi:hypothetical protein